MNISICSHCGLDRTVEVSSFSNDFLGGMVEIVCKINYLNVGEIAKTQIVRLQYKRGMFIDPTTMIQSPRQNVGATLFDSYDVANAELSEATVSNIKAFITTLDTNNCI